MTRGMNMTYASYSYRYVIYVIEFVNGICYIVHALLNTPLLPDWHLSFAWFLEPQLIVTTFS